MRSKKLNNGFTLFLAVIVIGISLVIGLGVFDIIYREIVLSASGRESQKAFYAADTGAECAIYWDVNYDAFSTTSVSLIKCVEQELSVGGSETSSFRLYLPNGTCVNVEVDKSLPPYTIIESRGYNIDCDSTNPRKVERGLRVVY